MSGILIAASVAGPSYPTSSIVCTDEVLSPGIAVAEVDWRADGDIYDQDNTNKGDWILPGDYAPGDYEVRANSASPDTPESGTMDTWLALTSTRTWGVSQNGFGTDIINFTVDIRRSGGPVLATRSVQLRAIVDV